jgi:hypothetical protein
LTLAERQKLFHEYGCVCSILASAAVHRPGAIAGALIGGFIGEMLSRNAPVATETLRELPWCKNCCGYQVSGHKCGR